MARTALTSQPISSAGVTPTYAAANVDGHSFQPVAGRFLHVKNGSAGSVTVTLPTPGTVDGLAITDRTVAVGAGAESMIGVGKGTAYRQDGGVVHVDFSAVTSVTVALFDVP